MKNEFRTHFLISEPIIHIKNHLTTTATIITNMHPILNPILMKIIKILEKLIIAKKTYRIINEQIAEHLKASLMTKSQKKNEIYLIIVIILAKKTMKILLRCVVHLVEVELYLISILKHQDHRELMWNLAQNILIKKQKKLKKR